MKKIALILTCLITICCAQDSETTRANELTERKLKIAQQCLKDIGKELTKKKIKTDSDEDIARAGELIKSKIKSQELQLELNRAAVKAFVRMSEARATEKRFKNSNLKELQPAELMMLLEVMQAQNIDLDRVTLLDHHITMLKNDLEKKDTEIHKLQAKIKKLEAGDDQPKP